MSKILYEGTVIELGQSYTYKAFLNNSLIPTVLELLDGEPSLVDLTDSEIFIIINNVEYKCTEVYKDINNDYAIGWMYEDYLHYIDTDDNTGKTTLSTLNTPVSIGDIVKIIDKNATPPEPSESEIATAIIRFDDGMTVLIKYNKETEELSYEILGG